MKREEDQTTKRLKKRIERLKVATTDTNKRDVRRAKKAAKRELSKHQRNTEKRKLKQVLEES